jgi:uncharacterized protein (DUF302 family)
MENLELDFKLTVAHVNTVLKHLGAGVYSEVADLITLLHGQAKPQIEDAAIAGMVKTEATPETIDAE